jgi:hypothetical protein
MRNRILLKKKKSLFVCCVCVCWFASSDFILKEGEF